MKMPLTLITLTLSLLAQAEHSLPFRLELNPSRPTKPSLRLDSDPESLLRSRYGEGLSLEESIRKWRPASYSEKYLMRDPKRLERFLVQVNLATGDPADVREFAILPFYQLELLDPKGVPMLATGFGYLRGHRNKLYLEIEYKSVRDWNGRAVIDRVEIGSSASGVPRLNSEIGISVMLLPKSHGFQLPLFGSGKRSTKNVRHKKAFLPVLYHRKQGKGFASWASRMDDQLRGILQTLQRTPKYALTTQERRWVNQAFHSQHEWLEKKALEIASQTDGVLSGISSDVWEKWILRAQQRARKQSEKFGFRIWGSQAGGAGGFPAKYSYSVIEAPPAHLKASIYALQVLTSSELKIVCRQSPTRCETLVRPLVSKLTLALKQIVSSELQRLEKSRGLVYREADAFRPIGVVQAVADELLSLSLDEQATQLVVNSLLSSRKEAEQLSDLVDQAKTTFEKLPLQYSVLGLGMQDHKYAKAARDFMKALEDLQARLK